MRILVVLAMGLLFGACTPANRPTPNPVLIVKTSPYSVNQTMDRLQAAVMASGAHVFARVDHGAAAKTAGLRLPPEAVLIFGNPKLGTPLMQQNSRFGLDLPLKVLVWQEDDATKLAYTAPASLGARYGVDPSHPVLVKMGKVLDAVTNEAAGPSP